MEVSIRKWKLTDAKDLSAALSNKHILNNLRDGIPYGIYEGMFLFFDRKKRFKKGRLSCYINTAGDDRPKYRVSDKNIDGYKHLGRLVLTLRNYEV